ncbi:nicotinate-nucleotide--dimethylbenzimidazole phosphoribosyltransferase [Prauserella marina]|uniref:Nicotinate-nucleotide--dimethylbenzimidazole phosphoribosyltransferase n=1 Tax=Prauserella marina TaxID=530584 RepID=A0A222VLB1_9PSEU|nr:nicotinate-nucleotide--dimethylbenzimidazole phosphoribosyltransferase [Prauserella marina]ASR34632.1 nicotinate-nucleotide--dimethylbenzimidazole phosphoribosyltransferase [Prauserella marina]PWV85728.1 nicotinate-nucleotide-dimethylbenzimidazole phosphoribosyltransferase [Prauserella marina]SDC47166.1 nicotinate-nucleotide--dimethylbenzimidazole phosphoribosyltransferase [Prauserella marina]
MRFDIPALDENARARAREQLDGLVKPLGALGRLEDLAAWLCAAHGTVPPRPLDNVRVVVFAGDHGVTDVPTSAAVSAYPREITSAMVRVFHAGNSGVNVLARQAGAAVRVVDIAVDGDLDDLPGAITGHKIRSGSGPIDRTDALAEGEAERAFAAGRLIADEEIDAGADLLIPGDMGIGNTTIAAALVAATLGTGTPDTGDTEHVERTVGAGTGVDEEGRARKIAVIGAALARAGSRADEPFERLTALGSACAAATAGFLVQAAVRGVPVLLDGVFSVAAALVARDIAPDAAHWWLAGHRSTEPAQSLALKALGLDPVLDLGLRLGEGSGAVQAVPVLRGARAVLAEMGRLADLG